MTNNKAKTLRAIKLVSRIVEFEISGNAAKGRFAAGLASEGFAGGYLAALHDIDGFMRHGCPSDHRGYFRRALAQKDAPND